MHSKRFRGRARSLSTPHQPGHPLLADDALAVLVEGRLAPGPPLPAPTPFVSLRTRPESARGAARPAGLAPRAARARQRSHCGTPAAPDWAYRRGVPLDFILIACRRPRCGIDCDRKFIWTPPGGKGRLNVLGTGCSSISGLFVQDWCLLAPMESADPRLIPFKNSRSMFRSRLSGSRFALCAITSCRHLAQPLSGHLLWFKDSYSCPCPALRRVGQYRSVRTPGHEPARPRSCAPSCSREPPRRHWADGAWPVGIAIPSAPSRG